MSASDSASVSRFPFATSVGFRIRKYVDMVECQAVLPYVVSGPILNLMETTDPLDQLQDAERRIGRNMRRVRESLGLKQQDVADKMNEAGFKFHQTQVAKVERGERPVRVNEWFAIANALGIDAEALLEGGPGTDDRLWEAELHYERCRMVVDAAGVRLHEAGTTYQDALDVFQQVRTKYHEIAAEFGVEPKQPKNLLSHEAIEHIRNHLPAAAEYLAPGDLEEPTAETITMRYLREGSMGE